MTLQSKAVNKAEVQTLFIDNITEDISPADVRQSLTNIIDSYPDIYTIRKALTFSDLRTGNSVPINLVLPPGAGYALQAISSCVKYIANDGQLFFTDFLIITDTATSEQLNVSGSFNSAANGFPILAPTPVQTSVIENKGLNLKLNLDTAVGTGTAVVYLTYAIITL